MDASVPKEADHDNMLNEMNSQPDGECHNLIQEALEFSSIDLEASIPKEAHDNLLSEMNTSFSNLDLNLGELSQISTPMQQIEIPNSSKKMGNEVSLSQCCIFGPCFLQLKGRNLNLGLFLLVK